MASGLNIHIDKENATPSFVPNKGIFKKTIESNLFFFSI